MESCYHPRLASPFFLYQKAFNLISTVLVVKVTLFKKSIAKSYDRKKSLRRIALQMEVC